MEENALVKSPSDANENANGNANGSANGNAIGSANGNAIGSANGNANGNAIGSANIIDDENATGDTHVKPSMAGLPTNYQPSN